MRRGNIGARWLWSYNDSRRPGFEAAPGSHDSRFARVPVRMSCGWPCLLQQNCGTKSPRNQESAELGLRGTRSPRNQDRGTGTVEQGFRGTGSVPPALGPSPQPSLLLAGLAPQISSIRIDGLWASPASSNPSLLSAGLGPARPEPLTFINSLASPTAHFYGAAPFRNLVRITNEFALPYPLSALTLISSYSECFNI